LSDFAPKRLTFHAGTEPYAALDDDEIETSELGGVAGTYSRSMWFSCQEEEKAMAREPARRRWSGNVTETSDALDLEENIFKSRSARRIAASLKDSAEQSHRRKAAPFQSAMSMLNFLYQSRWQKPSEIAQAGAGGHQVRIAEPVRPRGVGLDELSCWVCAAKGLERWAAKLN